MEVCTRLELRRDEIEGGLLNRVKAVADTNDVTDPEYIEGLRRAISGSFDYALAGLRCSERHLPSVPVALLTPGTPGCPQRSFSRCGDPPLFRMRNAPSQSNRKRGRKRRSPRTRWFAHTLRVQGLLFDRLVGAVTSEHKLEAERLCSARSRRLAIVRGLLRGESLDLSELGYKFDAFHIAVVANGADIAPSVRRLAAELDCTSLTVANADGAHWTWFSRRDEPSIEQLARCASAPQAPTTHIAIGEAGVRPRRLAPEPPRSQRGLSLGSSQTRSAHQICRPSAPDFGAAGRTSPDLPSRCLSRPARHRARRWVNAASHVACLLRSRQKWCVGGSPTRGSSPDRQEPS